MLKIGDKVARRYNPSVCVGHVESDTTWYAANDSLSIKAEGGGFARCFKSGRILVNKDLKDSPFDFVLFKEEKKEPAILIVNKEGINIMHGASTKHEQQDPLLVTQDGSEFVLLPGDKVYKYVGEVKQVQLTEEEVPITVGYRYTNGSANAAVYETEVLAVQGDYAFIQSYKDGVAQGCTTIRVSNIPKQKRPCNKQVKQLVKE